MGKIRVEMPLMKRVLEPPKLTIIKHSVFLPERDKGVQKFIVESNATF